jgi:hypothetical protein
MGYDGSRLGSAANESINVECATAEDGVGSESNTEVSIMPSHAHRFSTQHWRQEDESEASRKIFVCAM